MGLAGFFLIILLATYASSMDHFGNDVGLTFGSVVRLISPHTGFMYASFHIAFIPTIFSSAEAV